MIMMQTPTSSPASPASTTQTSSSSSTFTLPIVVSVAGKPILERFCSETGDYIVIAPTAEDEICQLRHLEARREELCIELLEQKRSNDARVVERSLDLIRKRMQDVEVLCRYKQSIYSSLLAAQEPGFRPVPKNKDKTQERENRDGDGDDSEHSRGDKSRLLGREEQVSEYNPAAVAAAAAAERDKKTLDGLLPPLKSDSTGFRMDERDFVDSGYCIVFTCARDHPPSKLAQIQQQEQDAADAQKQQRTQKHHRSRLGSASRSSTPDDEVKSAGGNGAGERQNHYLLGRAPTMRDFLTFEMDKMTAAEKAEHDRQLLHERMFGNAASRKKQQQIAREAAQHQLSFSCDGRIDNGRFTEEGKVLAEKLRAAIETSLEKLPLARWGDENRRRGIETAVMGTLDSLMGVIVARNRQDAEDFFQILRKSETLLDEEVDELHQQQQHQQQQQQPIVPPSLQIQQSGKWQSASKINDATSGDAALSSPASTGLENQQQQLQQLQQSCGTPLHFVQKKKRRNPIGQFVKTLARVIPAGGSSACSDIVRQMAASKFQDSRPALDPTHKSTRSFTTSLTSPSASSLKPLKTKQTAHSSAWWMKTLSCTSTELCGLVDALQKVVTESTPFMQQRAHDIVIRGGTTFGALHAPDDARAAALCCVLDGDAGFEYSCRDVLFAAERFRKITESYFGEVVQAFGDYAVAVFWALPPQSVLEEYEFDEDTTAQLPKGVPLNRLSPATRAVLAAQELHAQVKRATCGISAAELPKKVTNDEVLGRPDYDLFGLRERAYTYNKMGLNTTGEYVSDRDKEKKMEQHRLKYNCMAHTTPLVSATGAALDKAVELALMSERVLRRPVVVCEPAAEEVDQGVTRLSRFSHNLVEYYTPVALESLRLDEPPAEKLIGRFNASSGTSSYSLQSSSTNNNNNNNNNESLTQGMGVDDDDVAVDLSRSVVTGFTVAKKSNRHRINFHSIHSEPTLRRLFINLEPYRGCGYILRQQLKEALYPMCFVDPLRVQAGAALESELAALVRQKYEEFEANKYKSALANETSTGQELSPMEVMRLTLLQARKEQRKKDREKSRTGSVISNNSNDPSSHGTGASENSGQQQQQQQQQQHSSLATQLREQHAMHLRAKEGNTKRKAKLNSNGDELNTGGGHNSNTNKRSYFNAEDAIGNRKARDKFEVQSDIHPDVLKMYKAVFGDDLIGVTHDVLDTMLRPMRMNEASEHVTFPEFLLFAARLQQE